MLILGSPVLCEAHLIHCAVHIVCTCAHLIQEFITCMLREQPTKSTASVVIQNQPTHHRHVSTTNNQCVRNQCRQPTCHPLQVPPRCCCVPAAMLPCIFAGRAVAYVCVEEQSLLACWPLCQSCCCVGVALLVVSLLHAVKLGQVHPGLRTVWQHLPAHTS
jgi:hypothetical protein